MSAVMVKGFSYFLAVVIILLLVLFIVELPFVWRLFYPLRYKDIIIVNARANDLDPALVAAVIRVESGFRPDAISPRGARGLMQLMPATARDAAGKLGYAVEGDFDRQLLEPELNIALGTWYLADLLRLYNGDTAKALAAYNAGRGKVNYWLAQGVWDGTWANREQIPYAETRDYLHKVRLAWLKYAEIYRYE